LRRDCQRALKILGPALMLGLGNLPISRRCYRELHREDEIYWKWTSSGEYTTKSAYQIQFDESFAKIKIFPIWKARAEWKCRFFAWTLLHPKILTSNNLSKRNWLHDPICKVCKFNPETLSHLCKDYIFIEEVWSIVRNWFNLS